jgi:hypothetical protein
LIKNSRILSREIGPCIPESMSSELDYFSLYFDKSVVKMLIARTNDYVEQKKNVKKHMYRRFCLSPLTE